MLCVIKTTLSVCGAFLILLPRRKRIQMLVPCFVYLSDNCVLMNLWILFELVRVLTGSFAGGPLLLCDLRRGVFERSRETTRSRVYKFHHFQFILEFCKFPTWLPSRSTRRHSCLSEDRVALSSSRGRRRTESCEGVWRAQFSAVELVRKSTHKCKISIAEISFGGKHLRGFEGSPGGDGMSR